MSAWALILSNCIQLIGPTLVLIKRVRRYQLSLITRSVITSHPQLSFLCSRQETPENVSFSLRSHCTHHRRCLWHRPGHSQVLPRSWHEPDPPRPERNSPFRSVHPVTLYFEHQNLHIPRGRLRPGGMDQHPARSPLSAPFRNRLPDAECWRQRQTS